jgi:hypothetical protein
VDGDGGLQPLAAGIVVALAHLLRKPRLRLARCLLHGLGLDALGIDRHDDQSNDGENSAGKRFLDAHGASPCSFVGCNAWP